MTAKNPVSRGHGMDDAFHVASNCRHYAMCKIDYLGTGMCESGTQHRYVAYYPQGRMDLYYGLVKKIVPFTEKCIDIVQTCNLCGRCDYQCSFYTGMKPTKVMGVLKSLVTDYLASGGTPVRSADDHLVSAVQDIVGAEWATNDKAIAIGYARDPSPIARLTFPQCVILPGNRDELCAVVKLLYDSGTPFAVRASGTNLMGFTLSQGAVIDVCRMDSIEFDEKNWIVTIGPGVPAFNLQRECVKKGYRVSVAEPAALVCGSMMCMGIVSLFSTAYGASADNYVDAEFVANDGSIFSLNERSAPNLFAFDKKGAESPGICSSLKVKLHPMTDDEEGLIVPFESLDRAIEFSRECAVRRLGIAIGILGTEYFASFVSPSEELAESVKKILGDKLQMKYSVLVIGDTYALRSIRSMGHPVIDQNLFSILNLGLPSLISSEWTDLIADLSKNDAFSYLDTRGFAELAEVSLCPSASRIASSFDHDLRGEFEKIYSRKEMTDLVWLNMFRIKSARIGRGKNFFPFLMYLPLEYKIIRQLCENLENIAQANDLKNAFGFITPVDMGKRCILEYDYFFDQNDSREISAVQKAFLEATPAIDSIAEQAGTIRWVRYIFQQGYSRKDNILYA
ncbi:MAG: FAD-dependent oxidoreductase [Syntrophorhabdus sp.]